jgi:sugar phosphate isomerase/epimerase
MRSGLDPVEQLRKLQGHIISLHFKDLNKLGEGAHDVPWGTGKGNVKAMLEELHRQGFQGVFAIEYEHNWTSSLPEIAECVKYFDQVAAEISSTS